MATKISALVTAASAANTMRTVVVSGSTNKQIWFGTNSGGGGLFANVTFCVEATVAASATANIVALASCDIVGFYIRALPGSSAAGGGSQVQIGVAADQTRLATHQTSGAGFYVPTAANMSAAAMRNFTGTITAVAPTASANGIFMVGASYIRR